MSNDEGSSWLTLKVEEVGTDGIEVSKVSKLLSDLSSVLHAIARQKLGITVDKPGPRTPEEEYLASFRLVRIAPGSLVIELDPPPAAPQLEFEQLRQTDPEDIALDLYREIESFSAGTTSPSERADLRRRVATLVQDIGEIGSKGVIIFHPKDPGRFHLTQNGLEQSFDPRKIPIIAEAHTTTSRHRVFGRTYMVDVEPGRERLRIKLPDGRDMTIPVDVAATGEFGEALDRVVEVEFEEEATPGSAPRRTVQSLEFISEPSVLDEKPPRTLDELAEEQGLAGDPPDYIALASEVWTTREEVDEFDRQLREWRHAASA